MEVLTVVLAADVAVVSDAAMMEAVAEAGYYYGEENWGGASRGDGEAVGSSSIQGPFEDAEREGVPHGKPVEVGDEGLSHDIVVRFIIHSV